MPVKWTPENDQLLLLKILETHDLTVDGKKISEAWPDDKGEKPTARAITERLVKIRQNVKGSGGAGFAIATSQGKSKPAATAPKPARTKPSSSSASSAKTTASKRKHEPEPTKAGNKTSQPFMNGRQVYQSVEVNVPSSDEEPSGSPPKRARKRTPIKQEYQELSVEDVTRCDRGSAEEDAPEVFGDDYDDEEIAV